MRHGPSEALVARLNPMIWPAGAVATHGRGGTPPRARAALGFTPGTKKRAIDLYRDALEEHAQSFVDARLQIINDPTAPPSDRLRAMQQLESRALGKPKETLVQETEEPQALRLIREMSDEELEAALRRTAPPDSPLSN